MSKNSEHTQTKQQWLAQRLKHFNNKQSSFGINPQSRPPTLPLSFAQQRLWFLEQWEPGSTAYLMPYAWRLHGPLDLPALEAGLTTLVTRHDSLRTTFALVEGHPVQVIAPVAPVSLPVLDLTSLPASTRDAEVQRLVHEDAHQPFDLTVGSLWRVQILRLDHEEHVLLFTLHHIITDGWSMGIMFQELTTIYSAQVTGQPATLPPLPIQYADFAIWQRQWLQGDVLDRQVAYWRTKLTGAPPSLDLSTDAPRPPQETYNGARLSFTLPPSLTQELKTLSQRENTTLFMTLLAAFQILLARYAGQRDILVGTPIAGRTQTEVEGLIGFFVNTLVIRTQLNGQPTFLDVLHQVRESCLEAYAHQDLPFEKLVEVLQPVRDPSRHPIFQIMFQLHHADSTGEFTLPPLEVVPLPTVSQTTKFDLWLGLVLRGETLEGTVTFNTDLFEPSSMKRLATHYHTLLERLVAEPTKAVSHLPLLTNPERHQLLVEWNPPTKRPPPAATVLDLFEAQVGRTPDAIAVVDQGAQLTYAVLNQRANQLAHYFRQYGVGPEVRVGVCLERSGELIICLLAILKAEGAYVPLDPAYPSDRLALMLEDADVAVVLTREAFREVIPAVAAPVESLESLAPQLGLESSVNPSRCSLPHHLAYLIYTSGSSGQPKGVLVSHHGLGNLVCEQQRLFRSGPESRVLQFASISFDASLAEILMALEVGGTLVIESREALQPGPPLLAVLQQHAITLVTFPPSLLAILPQEPLPALATLLVAGEYCLGSLIEQWSHGRTFFNLYGPTEGTIWSTAAAYHGHEGEKSSIGRPIANITLYVLDSDSHPVPIGVPGEAVIGGLGIARGYLNHPALTAQQFVPDPFSGVPGCRLYKTGDRVRYHQEGTLDYLGRLDHQVKLRGFRIELGEIEDVLTQHPAVQDAVVLCREDTPNEKRLVAYVVPAPETTLVPETLRTYLKTRLPNYMLPSAFVILDELPLTSNGKVNRQVLPVPDQTHRTQATASVPPRTPLEEILAEIWQGLLKVDHIGVHDNFFDLGGHSLLATQVMARTRALLRMEVSIRTLFEGPTIAQLAKSLEALGSLNLTHQSLPLCPQSHEGPLPLSFAQQRLWFLEQWEPGSTAYLLPYAWRLKGTLDLPALETSLTALVTRHDSLRTTFAVVDGHPVQIIAPVAPVSLPVLDLTSLPASTRDTKVQRLIQKDADQPFDLTIGPLWRAQLLRLGSEDHVLLLTLHHIITDGWSMGIMFQELNAFYTEQITGQQAELSPLPLQYADFAIWQRKWLQDDVLDRQLTYWHTQLDNAPPYLDFPTDARRPSQQTYRGAQLAFALPPALTLGLKRLSQQEGVTLFMTLLAAFQILLVRYTGQRDILVGTPIAGRTHTELEGLLGFFVNTLIIRTRFTGHLTFRDLLRQVRDTCLDGYAHQDVPFEKLVEVLQPARDPSRHPLFQVMFQLHHAHHTDSLILPDLEVVPQTSVSQTAKFDLSLWLVMKGDTLQGTVTFNTDLFESATIRRLATHYHTLLEGMVANPTLAVSHLPLLTEAERQQLLVEWNPSVPQPPPSLCVHDLFDAQAVRTPEAVAVVYGEEQLTYGALNERANQLAQYLIYQGIGPDVRVGVYLERSMAMVVGLLAILKAGGAYVPLDPTAPPDRLRFMLEDAEVAMVLTSAALRGQIAACWHPSENPVGQSQSTLVLDMEWPNLTRDGFPFSLPVMHAENLAYVMYTSGSTGQPKGVTIPHRGVVRLIRHPTYLELPPHMVCLQLASPAFDAATFEIWACLIHGGKLVLGPPLLPSLDELGTLLQHHQITILWLTAGLFHHLVDWNLEALRPIRTLLAGGDVLSPSHVRRITEQLPTCQLINGYGPTENTTFTCCYTIPPAGDFGDSVPIGRPIAHTQLYVLDAQQHLAPLGGAGELCIGGLGLARGYHRRPQLTAEKFIPHPFRSLPGARLYRSGDIARYRHDGTLEFMGRRDHQVKIRGYRIECAEIETLLTAHPAVQEAVVLPRKDSVGNKRLVAYIVRKNGPAPHISEFRDFLSQNLPSYMIPGGFIFLEAFPLTINGKVDRHKLPVEDQRSSQEKEAYVAPRNGIESQLTKIWETVLRKHPIGITDNFFILGGESLMAIRLCSEMERTFHKKISLPLIFHAQTIEQLARLIDQGEEDAPLSLLVAIQPSGSNPPIFCFGFGSNFRPYLKDYPKQPVYMFLNPGHDGRPVLNTSVEKVATQCVKEMRTVQPEGPYYLGGYSFGGIVVYEMAQQLRRQGETIKFLALVDPTTFLSKPASPPRKSNLNHLLTTAKLKGNQWSRHLSIMNISHAISKKCLEGIQWRWNKLRATSWTNIREMLCNIYFGFRYPLPTFLRRFYRDIVVTQTARQYIPQPYPGQIVIFQTNNSIEAYWRKLCTDVVQVHDLPCKHADLYLDKPHTSTFLNQLMNHLE